MKRNDWFIILGVVILAVGIYLWNNMRSNAVQFNEKFVEVRYNGNLYDRVNLLDDKEIVVETKTGKNVILVKDGKVEMVDADCPDKVCIRTGIVHKAGQNIVCLPNEVHVEIVGSMEDGIDAVIQ